MYLIINVIWNIRLLCMKHNAKLKIPIDLNTPSTFNSKEFNR